MFLKKVIIYTLSKNLKNRPKQIGFFKCDYCFNFYTVSINLKKVSNGISSTFCTKFCANLALKIGGLSNEKMKKTCMNLYGTEIAMQSSIVQNNYKSSCIENLGVSNPLLNKAVKDKQSQTNIERYGVTFYFQSSSFQQKSYQTKKKNNSFQQSKPEEQLYEILKFHFGEYCVDRQKLINNLWPIDFYINSVDTYVQYDSYWHGYDSSGKLRDINEVSELKHKQDNGILIKMDIDKRQNVWFKQQNLKLVRIICNEYRDENLVLSKILNS